MDWALVTGTVLNRGGGDGKDDGNGHIRDIHVTFQGHMSDPRVEGDGAATLNVDTAAGGEIGVEWGAVTIVGAGGKWEGTCRGVAWSAGEGSDIGCWYAGSGAYKGLTFYAHMRTIGETGELTGMIFKGSPPAP